VLDIATVQSIFSDESGEHPDRFMMESSANTYLVMTRDQLQTTEWCGVRFQVELLCPKMQFFPHACFGLKPSCV
jgi:hypothetical protein